MQFVILFVGIWIAFFLVWWVFFNASRHADVDRLKTRLLGTTKPKKDKKSDQQTALLQDDRKTGLAARVVQRFQLQAKLHSFLEAAGLKWTPTKLVNICFAAGLAGFALSYFFLPGGYRQICYLVGAVSLFLPLGYVWRARKNRLKRFEELFPDSLEFVSRSMRAGHAFSVSLEMIHREFQEPLAGDPYPRPSSGSSLATRRPRGDSRLPRSTYANHRFAADALQCGSWRSNRESRVSRQRPSSPSAWSVYLLLRRPRRWACAESQILRVFDLSRRVDVRRVVRSARRSNSIFNGCGR